ncbi:hypothetical protein [Natrinema pallidum]|uniref:Uncharacterized protein n=1 Tax=Natrinema pallidum DSM 3751 TaxID=1227495 RepID=L9Z316_9EURY|nr:hypothetical protein [Natrinema pallidum]ELY80296.1 hypothetical protein C487_04725 [Natrinema pallidum DSM 3751]
MRIEPLEAQAGMQFGAHGESGRVSVLEPADGSGGRQRSHRSVCRSEDGRPRSYTVDPSKAVNTD